ncbi:PLP-dependent transferase [Ottowia testudinis]|uniref:PLP-dependent transferase n=1 Tax=Ottowia testudinis TaxID=2816950 RepID=A0A975CCJ5_9BURK|nr:PLP-dependent transferase [Ottowia testudinis]QTD43780.1 PLP-dependent transferase [Ottowia testudinis]
MLGFAPHPNLPGGIIVLAKTGVKEETVRLCVGIEHIDDLLADLEQALAKV